MSVAAGTDPISSESRNPRITYYFLSSHAGVTFYRVAKLLATQVNAQSPTIPGQDQVTRVYQRILKEGFEGQWRGALYAPSRTDLISLLGGQVTNANRTYDRAKKYPLPPHGRDLSAMVEGRTTTVSIEISDGIVLDTDENGVILGPQSEGMSAVVAFGRETYGPRSTVEEALRAAKAIKFPLLTGSDLNINYQIAENFHAENQQAASFAGTAALLSTRLTQLAAPRANLARAVNLSPGENAFVGIYISTYEPPRLGVITPSGAWPKDFAERLGAQVAGTFKRLQAMSEALMSRPRAGMASMFYISREVSVPQAERFGLGIEVDRKGIDFAYKQRDSGGWWFFPPVAISDWLAADFERMLTRSVQPLVDDTSIDFKPRDFDLLEMPLQEWFGLCKHLCGGIVTMHERGTIHGDIRPANIMRKVGVGVGSYEWIDLGMGAHRDGEIRQIGGGRVSVFFSPDRNENTEFEFIDSVQLSKIGRQGAATPADSAQMSGSRVQDDRVKLSLLYKPLTAAKAVPTELRPQAEVAASPLDARLQKGIAFDLRTGDRIQICNIMFEIDAVQSDHLIVRTASEIFQDRFFHRIEPVSGVVDLYDTLPVSKIRVHYRWGQASDIYGFGILILYMFFMKGMSVSRPHRAKPLIKAFEQLVEQLKNPTFLDLFLSFVFNPSNDKLDPGVQVPSSTNAIFQLPSKVVALNNTSAIEQADKPIFDRLHKIVIRAIAAEKQLQYVYLGLGSSPALFVKVLFLVLLCIWRREEVEAISFQHFVVGSKASSRQETSKGYTAEIFGGRFWPFCETRVMISGAPEKMAEPALAVLACLDAIITNFPPQLRAVPPTDGAQPEDKELFQRVDELAEELATIQNRMKKSSEEMATIQNRMKKSSEMLRKVEGDLVRLEEMNAKRMFRSKDADTALTAAVQELKRVREDLSKV